MPIFLVTLCEKLSDIPILDEDIVIESIKSNMELYIRQIPNDMFTENVCVEIFKKYNPPINWRVKTKELLEYIPNENLTEKSLSILGEKCPNAIFLVDVRSKGFNEVAIKILTHNKFGHYWDRSPSVLKIDPIEDWLNSLGESEKRYVKRDLWEVLREKIGSKVDNFFNE